MRLCHGAYHPVAGPEKGRQADQHNSGEIDIVSKAGLARALQEANEGGALLGPRPPPDDNDDPVMRLSFCQREEVIAIAGHEQTVSFEREPKHQRVCGLRIEHVSNALNLVAELAE